jgi:hypothetical protein
MQMTDRVIVCIPIIYFWYPETTGHTLEEIGALFDRASLDRPISSDGDGDEKPTVIDQPVPRKEV